MQFELLAPGHARSLIAYVDWYMHEARLGKILGQRPRQRKLKIPAPVLAQHDIANPDFEHIASAGAIDRDRAGKQMWAGPSVSRVQHLAMLRQNGKAGGWRWQIGRFAGKRIERHGIARTDGQDRGERAIPITPMYRLRVCGHVMMHVCRPSSALSPWQVANGLVTRGRKCHEHRCVAAPTSKATSLGSLSGAVCSDLEITSGPHAEPHTRAAWVLSGLPMISALGPCRRRAC